MGYAEKNFTLPIRLMTFLVAGVVAAVFFSRFPIFSTVILRHLPALGGVLIGLSAAWFLGHSGITVCERLLGPGTGRAISLTDALLVGVPIYGTTVAAISWTGVSIRIVITSATILLAALGAIPLARQLRSAMSKVKGVPVIILVPATVGAIVALMPVNSPDELIYKLSVPKAWLDWGRMVELPLCSGSYFPASIYSADLGVLSVAAVNGGAARLLHLVLFLLALRVVWRLGNDIRAGSGLWAAAIFAWTPALLIIAGWAWAEWGLLGLLLLSWHRFTQLVEENSEIAGATAALALAGAISAKYTAGPWVALFGPIAIFLLFRANQRVAWRRLTSIAAIVLVFGSFFYLRNLIWTGSLLAPFGLPDSPAVAGFRSDHSGWWELIRGYDIFFPEIIDDSLGMLLPISVLISPFIFVFTGRRQLPFFVLGLLQTIWLVSFAPTSRLMLLGFGPLVLLGAAAGYAAFQNSGPRVRFATVALMGVMFYSQLTLVAFTVVKSYDPLDYLIGAETESQYLARMRPFIRPYLWIDEKTPADSVILMLGQTHAWHLNRRAHWAGNLDGPRVATWLGQANSTEELQQQLKSLAVTHILIQKQWYKVGKSPDVTLGTLDKEFALQVTKETDTILQDLLGNLAVRRYEDNLHVIFELDSP
jgi:hypothetical protein